VLAAARLVGGKLVGLSKKNGGPGFEPWCLTLREAPTLVIGDRLTEVVKVRKSWLFYRAKEVDLPAVDGPGGPDGSLIVSAGRVRVGSFNFMRGLVFAAGPVEFVGATESVIVSSGDVSINFMLFKCLVIAGGKVVCKEPVHDSYIISGASVVHPKAGAINCKIIENAPNAFGYLRFSKASPKRCIARSGERNRAKRLVAPMQRSAMLEDGTTPATPEPDSPRTPRGAGLPGR